MFFSCFPYFPFFSPSYAHLPPPHHPKMFSSEPQGLDAKRQKEPSPSSDSSLARADTIKAGYFDDNEGAGKEEKRGAAAAGAAPPAGRAPPGPPSDLPPPPSSSPPSPEAAAARLAALSAGLERLQKNQAVLADALARGRAVLLAPSAAAAAAAAAGGSGRGGGGGGRRSTLRGALADPPLVDPSPGAQAAHKKRLQRQEARSRGGASGSEFVSGGLCGFRVAEDLLRADFAALASADGEASSCSAPASAAEFRAAAFDEPEPKQALRSLRSQAAELLPAGDPKLASFLKQLEAQQRIILRMLAESSAFEGGGVKAGSGGAGAGVGDSSSSSLIPASLMLSPLLKNPLARLAAAGMTVPDDEGTAVTERL